MNKISVIPYIILTSFVISIESSIAQPDMILVEGGTLPQSSEIAGANVAAFKINKYEVTWAEWLDVRNWALTNGYLDLDGIGVGIDSNNPVTNINWYYAVKWCNAKSEKEGLTPVYKHEGSVYRIGQQTNSPFFPFPGQPTPEPFDVSVDANANGYRLPTEAEWEWAARGGVLSQGTIYSGSNDIETVCWWRGNTIPRGARAVGSKAPNELGIFDMSGNVMEWCWDTVDMGPFMSYPWRRYRGGNFDWYEHECTVSHRRVGDPRYLGDDITGFRLAQSADNDAADSDGDGLSDAWERGFGRYQVIEGNFTWAQADADARSRNGHLATVGSATEWTFIKQLRAGHPYNGFLWLGGTDADSEGLWKWIDGTAWTFEAWGVGEPNNSMEEDRLMMLSATDNYVWNDLHGELDPFGYGTFGYLLEFGYPTDPFKADTDDDGYNDKVESDNGSDPNNAAATPEVTDRDNDGVNYYREIADGTDPTNATSFNALSVGLVAYYPFDGNANDESGNGYSGVLSGSISLTNDKQGSPASAYYFDGTEASIVVTNQVLDLGQSGYTITGWYKSYEPNKSYQTLFNTIPHTGIGIGFTSGFLPGKFPWGIGDGNDWLYFNAGDLQISLQPSSWFHWAFVKDGTFYKMFVNGRRSTDADVPQVAGLSRLAGFRLGSIGANNEAIHGVLDNVRVYNEALTQSRIKAIYFAESFSEADREFVLSHPDAMGHYSQTQYEEYGALQLSNGVSSVINNPSAFNLFTQSEYESFGALQFSNGISSVMSNPSAFNLFTQAEFNSNRTAGQSDVMNSPMSFGLYTSNSIMDLRMGGLMIQRQGTNAVVSFQPQTTTDLALPFTNNGTPITNTIPMPGNKGFIRINAKP